MSLRAGLSFLALLIAVPTGAILAAPPVPPPEGDAKLDVPYVPTPDAVLNQMLEFAAPTKDDFLIDLGSGDGRIPITAAKRHGTRGFGVDIDPRRIAEARANAEKEGVTDKVTFRQADLFDTEIREATVLTLYLLPAVNIRLRPRILDELRPGTRVVSHDFDMGDWKPDRTQQIGTSKHVYLWIVPAKVAGKWTVSDKAAGKDFLIDVKQDYQTISGSATIDGRVVPLRNAAVEGDRIVFEVAADGSQPKRYEGRLNNSAIEGDTWQAKPAT